jgi:hypothetical protein
MGLRDRMIVEEKLIRHEELLPFSLGKYNTVRTMVFNATFTNISVISWRRCCLILGSHSLRLHSMVGYFYVLLKVGVLNQQCSVFPCALFPVHPGYLQETKLPTKVQ